MEFVERARGRAGRGAKCATCDVVVYMRNSGVNVKELALDARVRVAWPLVA